MKKLFIIITVVLLLLIMLAACRTEGETAPSTDESESTAEAEQIQKISIVENGKSDYVIIYPENGTRNERSFTLDLSNAIRQATKAKLTYGSDKKTEPSEHEILIGNTSRSETAEAIKLMGDNDYIITVINEKIV